MGVIAGITHLESVIADMRSLNSLHDDIYEMLEKLEYNPRLDESQRRAIKGLMERLEEI